MAVSRRHRRALALLRRPLLAVLAGTALAAAAAAPVTVPVTTGHARAALAATVTVAPDEVTAATDAQAEGIPVEALSDRTDYAQVFANPDGTWSDNVAAAAQRVQNADGSWSPVDPTLALQADGTVRPAATPAGLVLSGGGTGPMLTVAQGSETMSLTWPNGALPAPTLAGPTATYGSVLPGVDLRITATTDGVSESLIVYTKKAASNPALSTLPFAISTSGLALTTDADGGASATDASGNVVFDMPEPQMWDSSGGDSTATAPGGTSAITPLPMNVTVTQQPPVGGRGGAATGTVGVSPTSSKLTSSSTVYPVYIDPSVTVHGPGGGWLDVGKNTFGQNYGDWEPSPARVGVWCSPDSSGNCPSGVEFGMYRTYFNFSVPHQIWDSQQVSATLFTNETYSWSCSAREVDLYRSDHASRGATWSTRPTRREFQDNQNTAHGWSSASCPAHGVSFSATPAAKLAASSHWSEVTLELQATDGAETNLDQFSWKKFEVSSGSQPFLQIVYDHQPDRPTNLTTLDGSRSVGCSSSTWISTTSPSLQAKDSDPDNQSIKVSFHYARSGGGPSGTLATSSLASGSTFTKGISGLTDGTYSWDAMGNDGTLSGPSASCAFSVDTSRPLTPNIASDIYTSGVAANPVGKVGTFTFTDPNNKDPVDGVNDVVAYRYGFTNPPLNSVPAGTDTNRTASVPISPVWLGSRTLFVQAVDRAGNLSPDDSTNPPAEFSVATIPPTGSPPLLADWKLGEGSGTTAADATGNGHGATLGAQAGWGAGRASGTSALSLTGAPDSEAFTAPQLPPVDNTFSFTVSAWVKLSPSCASTPSTCGFYDPVSMDGNFQDAFALEYVDQSWCGPGAGDGVHGCWGFNMAASDAMGASSATVEATNPVVFGTWVHLTGVFDSVHQTIAIYVNGVAASTLGPVSGVQPWAAPGMGPLRIGRVLFNGGAFNWWPGEVSDVCVFWGTLDATQVGNVFNSGCSSAGAP